MADQMELPLAIDEGQLGTFLTRYVAIENEIDRLNEDKRLLQEEYKPWLPMRATLTAVKVVRAQEKLIHHKKEPMSRVHLALLENLVQRHLLGLTAELEALAEETRAVPDMTRGG